MMLKITTILGRINRYPISADEVSHFLIFSLILIVIVSGKQWKDSLYLLINKRKNETGFFVIVNAFLILPIFLFLSASAADLRYP